MDGAVAGIPADAAAGMDFVPALRTAPVGDGDLQWLPRVPLRKPLPEASLRLTATVGLRRTPDSDLSPLPGGGWQTGVRRFGVGRPTGSTHGLPPSELRSEVASEAMTSTRWRRPHRAQIAYHWSAVPLSRCSRASGGRDALQRGHFTGSMPRPYVHRQENGRSLSTARPSPGQAARRRERTTCPACRCRWRRPPGPELG